MKIALYIEDGLEQVVLTPESETERAILGKMHDGSRALSIKRGAFYGCQGGWVRQRPVHSDFHGAPLGRDDDSTMVVLTPAVGRPLSNAVDLIALADAVRAVVQNMPRRFYGDGEKASEIAGLWQSEIADAAHSLVLKQVGPRP